MLRKGIILVIIGLFLGAIFGLSISGNIEEKQKNENINDYNGIILNLPEDELDQQQTEAMVCWAGWDGDMFAQSFVPTKNTLTRVKLKMYKEGNPYSLTISIRNSLTGSDLTSITKYSDEIDAPAPDSVWIEFDFEDTTVVPGQKYYIIWCQNGAGSTNDLFWWCADYDSYPNGEGWHFDGSTWKLFILDEDFCFKTYGYNIDNLEITLIKPVQVIYDADFLIKDKKTSIYVAVNNNYEYDIKVNIKVTYNFGSVIIDKGLYNNGITLKPKLNWIFLMGGPVIYNGDFEDKLDPWLEGGEGPFLKWTHIGTDSLVIEIIPLDNNIEGITDDITVNIVNTDDLDIGTCKINAPLLLPYGNPTDSEYEDSIEDNIEFIKGTYPIYEEGINNHYGNSFLGSDDIWLGFEKDLITLIAKRLVSGYDQYVGVTTDNYFPYHLMSSKLNGACNPSCYWGVSIIVFNTLNKETVMAHEIGHHYWLGDEYSKNPYVPGNPAYGFWVDHRLPKYYQYIRTADVCFMGDLNDHLLCWVCDGCYNKLINEFKNEKISNNKEIAKKVNFVSGFVFKNKSVNINEIYNLNNAIIFPPVPGNHSFNIYNSENELLDSIPFKVSFEIFTDPEGVIETNFSGFAFSIPYKENVSKIEIKDGNDIIYMNEIGKNYPQIELINPNGGETFVIGGKYIIRWNAYDIDGDKLSYCIYFSDNNGDIWTLLDIALKENEYIWDTSNYTPSDKCKIRVLVSDGVNNEIDDSDSTFTILNLSNLPPDKPSVSYNKANDEIIITTTDPDGNQIRYGISWENDYTIDQWTDFVDSGTEQRVDCNGRKVTIGVVVEDEHGARSDWVSIKSRNQVKNTTFLNFLENFPRFYLFIQQILNL